ncbi:MAG: hypothetical protein JSU90_04500, partial [Nitrospiraceae bacterium]
MNILKKIVELTKPYWPRVAGGIVISLLLSGITAVIAWAVKPALDEIFVRERYEYLTILPAGVFLLFITKGVLDFLQAYLMRSAGLKLMRETRNRLYNHILYLPIGYFSRESSGVVISRVMHDVEMLKDLISNVIRNFVVAVPTALFLLGVAFFRKWDLTLMTLVLMPFLAYSTRKFGKRIKKKRKEAQRMMSFLTQNVGETILGSRIVRIFTRESFMVKRFEGENRRYYREMLRVVRFKEFTALITDMVTGLGIAIILWYGGGMVQKGVMTPGDFASVIVAIYMLFPPIKKI